MFVKVIHTIQGKHLSLTGIRLLLIIMLCLSLTLGACSSKSDNIETGTPKPTQTAPAITAQTHTPNEVDQISDGPAEGVEGEYIIP